MAKRPTKSAVTKAAAPTSKDAAPPADAGPAHPITRLDQLIGQESAKRILQAALASGRVHHAWIFHGPPGVGKMTAAYAFAATLLDPTTAPGLTGEIAPDPDSPVQQLARAGNHPDLHIITKEMAAISREPEVRKSKQTSIASAVIDEFLLEPAARMRAMDGASPMAKVFIIDEAELVTANVQNTLLKTLEEPPPGTAIILVTSSEDRLLPTIRSRCQRVAFCPLEDKEMDRWFKQAGVSIDHKRGEWVRAFAGGSPGLARLAIDAELYQWHEEVSPLLTQLDKGQFAPDLGATLAKLIGERAEADVKANSDASKDGANKVWARRMLAFVADHYRSKVRAGAGKDPEDPATSRWLAALETVNAAEGHLASNVNLAMLLENMAAQLATDRATA